MSCERIDVGKVVSHNVQVDAFRAGRQGCIMQLIYYSTMATADRGGETHVLRSSHSGWPAPLLMCAFPQTIVATCLGHRA